MDSDKVLALGEKCGMTQMGIDEPYYAFYKDELLEFADLIEQQLIKDGWRSPEQMDEMAVVCYGEEGIESSLGFRAVPLDAIKEQP